MKRRNGKSMIVVSFILLVSLVFSQIPADSSAKDNTKDNGYDYNCYSRATGLKEPTEGELEWFEESMIKTEGVKLNELGAIILRLIIIHLTHKQHHLYHEIRPLPTYHAAKYGVLNLDIVKRLIYFDKGEKKIVLFKF